MRDLVYLVAILIILSAIYWIIVRPWHIRWGTTDNEVDVPLPGDDLVDHPTLQETHAITIKAPASAIWPWLVQIGQEKGGLYSYDWLENLIGCNIHSADHIVPEWQNTQVGDKIRMGPKGYPLFVVREIIPERAFILQGADPKTEEPGGASWAFVLNEQADGTTRLIARSRNGYEPTLANFVIWQAVTEPLSFMMEQKMLRSLKALAERTIVVEPQAV